MLEEDGEDGVWPENVGAVLLFLSAQTQWRVGEAATERGPRIVWIGLDYGAVKAGADMGGSQIAPDDFAGLRIMEAAARDALNGFGS